MSIALPKKGVLPVLSTQVNLRNLGAYWLICQYQIGLESASGWGNGEVEIVYCQRLPPYGILLLPSENMGEREMRK
jgi:hypothetical protein